MAIFLDYNYAKVIDTQAANSKQQRACVIERKAEEEVRTQHELDESK